MNKITYWLVGMPNVGKSSLFQIVTKARVKIGNWEGVTLRCRSEAMYYGQLVDTPGRRHVYINEPNWSISPIEWVGREDYRIIHVVDAAFLDRDLALTAQWKSLGLPLGVVIHRSDLNENLSSDLIEKWSLEHNVPVVCSQVHDHSWLPSFHNMLDELAKMRPGTSDAKRCADAFDQKQSVTYITDWFDKGVHWAGQMVKNDKTLRIHKNAEILDSWFLKSSIAPLIGWAFLCMSLLVMLWLGQVFQLIAQFVWLSLVAFAVPEVWQDFWLLKGMLDSVDVLIGLVPLVFFVYVWLASLEQSGYGSRLGVLLTPLLKWAGLPGGIWVSMMLGFGCNVPAIQSLSAVSYPKHRLIAASLLPMVPCSARLMVFVVIAGMMHPANTAWMVLSLYALSMMVVFVIARVLSAYLKVNHPVFRAQRLVPYHKPVWSQVFQSALIQTSQMITRILVYVLPLNVCLSLLMLPIGQSHAGLLTYVGQYMSVIFYPIGIGSSDWPFVMALVTGLVSKEAMLATLGSLGLIQDLLPQPDNLYALFNQIRAVTEHLFLIPVVRDNAAHWSFATSMAYLMFVSLYVPCVSTYAMLRKVIGRRANIAVVMSLIIAYVIACLTYVVLSLPTVWNLSIILCYFSFVGMRYFTRGVQYDNV